MEGALCPFCFLVNVYIMKITENKIIELCIEYPTLESEKVHEYLKDRFGDGNYKIIETGPKRISANKADCSKRVTIIHAIID